jgi:hypothetical protein
MCFHPIINNQSWISIHCYVVVGFKSVYFDHTWMFGQKWYCHKHQIVELCLDTKWNYCLNEDWTSTLPNLDPCMAHRMNLEMHNLFSMYRWFPSWNYIFFNYFMNNSLAPLIIILNFKNLVKLWLNSFWNVKMKWINMLALWNRLGKGTWFWLLKW